MGYFLDRLSYFTKKRTAFAGGHGMLVTDSRQWEDGYRGRWRFDKIARSTHGVNCTGGCSWRIYVKNGLVAFETQYTDYPCTRPDLPNHEPRGCQRGASYSWYLYSPHRIKHPMVRGRLLALYRAERESGLDPVAAWAAIQQDPDKRRRYTAVRGLGGFVRATWDEVTEMIAAANVYTIQTHGPDRIIGFSPIPAMSMISYAAGSRYLSLIGGVPLSFYDWYCDLPPSSPQTWGEQTDVPEAADWYNATYIIVAGTNLPMTRTPDAHFYAEVRYKGAKVVAVAPDYAEYVKFADLWMPARAGTDAALFMAMNHVVLSEYYIARKEAYFQEYAREFTDLPMQVLLRALPDGCYAGGRFLRAADLVASLGQTHNAEWKTVVYDTRAQAFACPNGSIGFRWGEDGKWNLRPEDAADGGRAIEAELSCAGHETVMVKVRFPHFATGESDTLERQVPARRIRLADGREALVSSVFDLLAAQYGVARDADAGRCAALYDDATCAYTPAWQERITGVARADVLRVAREFADNAARTRGKSMVIVGAGTNHWYHNDMNYRSIISLLELCGCVGQSGGGWAHYVGQEKLRPQAGWAPVAFALDWARPARQMAGTSFFYQHTDQWRYEKVDADSLLAATAEGRYRGHSLADYAVVAERLGWLPSAPHFNENPLTVCARAQGAGAGSEAAVAAHVAAELKSGALRFASEDPDDPANWPRNLFVWRANLIGTSAKGHEYFLKHLLGAQNGVLGRDSEGRGHREITWRDEAPIAKLDLMVDINFRLNSTGAYADIILPTATWYEKNDLNTTDMHPFIHPLSEAVEPGWESRSDWQIFKAIACAFSELGARHLGVRADLLAIPLMHDSPSELGQPLAVRDWKRGECEPVPGKTMPQLRVVERDYGAIYQKYIALGPLLVKEGNGTKGLSWDTREAYEALGDTNHKVTLKGVAQGLPSLENDIGACEAILALAPETNGEIAFRAWRALEQKTGLALTHLASARRDDKIRFRDIQAQPRKIITSPTWSGIESEHVSYAASYTNIHERIPFRTLTGRAQFYQDHEWMRDFGEAFCAYRPPLDMKAADSMPAALKGRPHLMLNWLTPHSKWGIHSTYNDNLRMLNLFRGGPTIWISEDDARSIGLADNDWVEAVNANGATVARAVVSQRIPRGAALMYHAQEKTVNVPGSPTTTKRGGILNSVTRVIVKPTHMIGGYAHLAWGFNYYGPVGSQRDEVVLVRRLDDTEIDWRERPLDDAREAALDPPRRFALGEEGP
ncbi:nitrate reductase subunit alpha [Acidiferrobacter sp.]|uniref:nitrate reductase subunit alpha n=1 Tax=Acidiferrobacter sp. TaxID=1872107 RepID=UPI002622712B|nr:nitrate reductase subunit alpha [Acidiferrobacter sp.]